MASDIPNKPWSPYDCSVQLEWPATTTLEHLAYSKDSSSPACSHLTMLRVLPWALGSFAIMLIILLAYTWHRLSKKMRELDALDSDLRKPHGDVNAAGVRAVMWSPRPESWPAPGAGVYASHPQGGVKQARPVESTAVGKVCPVG